MKKIFLILTALFLTLAPMTVFGAADVATYKLLAPIPFVQTANGWTDVNRYLPGLVTLLIAVAAVLAVVRIIFAGFTYMTTDAFTGKSSAKEDITNALLGLLLVAASYIILNTLNPDLVKFDFTIKHTATGEALEIPNLENGSSTTPTLPGIDLNGRIWPGDGPQRYAFRQAGIAVKDPECTKVGNKGCTSVYGIGSGVMPKLQQLKKSCPKCDLTITGGTEYWLHGNLATNPDANNTHHRPGYSVADLRSDSDLDAYVKKQGQYLSPDKVTSCYTNHDGYLLNGSIFIWETTEGNSTGDHWHVCF